MSAPMKSSKYCTRLCPRERNNYSWKKRKLNTNSDQKIFTQYLNICEFPAFTTLLGRKFHITVTRKQDRYYSYKKIMKRIEWHFNENYLKKSNHFYFRQTWLIGFTGKAVDALNMMDGYDY